MPDKNPTQQPGSHAQYLYTLDILRGIASLAVIFFHWHFFYRDGTSYVRFNRTRQPFYEFLFPLYDKGMSVDLFFLISGFTFFWLYSERISVHATTAWDFAVQRFSRLYPLHLLTLLIVAAGQMYRIATIGKYLVWPYNDLYHFVLNLFLASSWGLEKGLSFNAPIWFVSVQVLLYTAFFIICITGKNHPRYLAVLSIAGFIFWFIYSPIGMGVCMFFLGGLLAHLYKRIVASGKVNRWVMPLIALTVSGWVLAIADEKLGFLSWLRLLPPLTLKFQQQVYAAVSIDVFSDLLVVGILFPLTLMTAVILGTRYAGFGRRLSFLGNQSYALYLLHFPLILVFSTVTISLGMTRRFYFTEVSLFLFLSVLYGLSMLTYRYFEIPARDFLRAKLLRGSPKLKSAESAALTNVPQISQGQDTP